MKRILLPFICIGLLLSLTSVVFAEATTENILSEDEPFTLFNDIYFGEDYESVLNKVGVGFESGDDYEVNNEDEGICRKWTNNIKVAGIEDTTVNLAFKDGKLVEVAYKFPPSDSRESCEDQYSRLYDSLTQKYGGHLGNTDGTTDLITSFAFKSPHTIIAVYKELGYIGEITDYEEWKYTEPQNYNVKIDLVSFCYGKSSDEAEYENIVGYKMYTDEEYEEKLEQKQSERQEMDDDL